MLQNASYMFFLKKDTKQNKTTTKKKKSHLGGVEPRTFDVKGQRINHCATQPWLTRNVKLIVFDIFVPTTLIIQDGAENADIRQNEYHKSSPLSNTGIPRLCVALS